MTGSFTSLQARGMLLDAFLRPDVFAAPSDVWVALTLAVPLPGDDGSDLLEPEDEVYGRQLYGLGSAWWSASGSGERANAQPVLFSTPTVNWGQIKGWALTTEATGGVVMFGGPLRTPRRVLAGSEPVGFDAGSLIVRYRQ